MSILYNELKNVSTNEKEFVAFYNLDIEAQANLANAQIIELQENESVLFIETTLTENNILQIKYIKNM